MPLPDLARPSRVEAKLSLTKPANATAVTILTCPADTTIRLRTMYVANQTAAAQTFNLSIGRSAVGYPIHAGVTVPAKNLFNATTVDDAVYLEPGDTLGFSQTSATPALTLFVSYELVT